MRDINPAGVLVAFLVVFFAGAFFLSSREGGEEYYDVPSVEVDVDHHKSKTHKPSSGFKLGGGTTRKR